MLANYLANGLGKKVAVIELNTNKDFMRIRHQSHLIYHDTEWFTYCGIDFYQNGTSVTVQQLNKKEYDYLIMDMGNQYSEYENELAGNSQKIIVADMELWKIGKLYHYLSVEDRDRTDSDTYVSVTYQSQLAKKLKREFKVEIQQVPLERNPFAIRGENLTWFQRLLEEQD